MMTTNTLRVLNWRRRYAAAPSCMARAMSCICWVPWPAASTSRTSAPATPSASSATTATMTTQVRLEPLTLTELAASAETCRKHSTSCNSERERCRSGTNEWPGVYARTSGTMNTGPFLTIT